MAKKGKDYRFIGRPIDGRGTTLAEAFNELADYWNSRPSLVMHDYGAIDLQIQIEGELVAITITNPETIDQIEGGNYEQLVELLAKEAGITTEQMNLILSSSTDTEITATVDKIRPKSDPDYWVGSAPSSEPHIVLPQVIGDLAVAASHGRNVTEENRQKLLAIAVGSKAEEGENIGQIAKETGLPPSTVRDRVARKRRELNRRKISEHAPGKKYSSDQIEAILRVYDQSKNASEVERQLGVPARSVRSIVKRSASVDTIPQVSLEPSSRKEQILELVRQGMSASAAGRSLGVPERTARSWVKKSKG